VSIRTSHIRRRQRISGRMTSVHRLFHAYSLKQLCCTREILCLQSLLPTPSIERRHMKPWRKLSISWSTRQNKGIFAVILRQQQFLSKCEMYTKFCCFLYEWDGNNKSIHYSKNWPLRKLYRTGKKNVTHQPLVEPCKMLYPTLHTIRKSNLTKNFLQALHRYGPEFSFLCEKFQRFSIEKIKVGVFLDLQTRQLFTDPQFARTLSEDEKTACNALRNVETGYLGNEKPLYMGRSQKIL
jgi:hypothetical protein